MYYYQFNIGDYASHTSHLDEMEDLAYRRMLDYCYLNEIGLPESVEEIARLIRMRTHCDRIANVLHEFFTLHSDDDSGGVWRQSRIDAEVIQYREKSDKAKKAARKRWENNDLTPDADALPTHSERNAKHKPLTINHKPIDMGQNRTRFVPPSVEDVAAYVSTRDNPIDPARFIDFYESKGWMVGKNKMKDWKASVRNWEKRNGSDQNTTVPAWQRVDERGISGAERTRRAREAARQRELAGQQSDMGCVGEPEGCLSH